MQFSAKQIGELLNGRIEGDASATISRLEKIEEASKGGLSFLANPKYEHFLYSTGASIVIVNEDLELAKPVEATLVRVKNAYSAFSVLLEQYNALRLHRVGREDPHFIHPTATIGENVYIGAFAYIGRDAVIGDNSHIYPHVYVGDAVRIGNDCVLYPGVKVYHDCVFGEKVIVHAGSVIGSDGFGFALQEDGAYKKVSQIGNVVLGNKVEVGANTTIDRATMGSTVIGDGVKLDNLIQLAHNVEIGDNTVIAAQTGISGSTKVGQGVVLGGQVGIAGHISIADGSQVQAQSGINRSIVDENKKWAGTPAVSFQKNMRMQVVASHLPELEKRVENLERKSERNK
ncbi:UDP-3-O-(3-hydroxymyristoyl)glucosamine N-acyltransferase [Olivibacter sitiensis]|uniref:UDP-3-O-(3-hydroxymyristoyl)glucosamine N-acyltransferase n=1 Tax=Olivibacter sitiensis TaxID=376470 RepID=UPI0003FB4101|nr:UDP-3-O-(3-hydroxymyristoyl)glucosamine N-acyltransferase [Olivibacter sitiensis]